MNLLKKNLALLLAVALCLSLAACGGDNDVVVGDDWRVTGIVCASGTITRDDGDVDVLVTVDENWAAFYWDDPEQILFDSVSFPMVIPDAQEYFDGISFDDISGDGESDVCVDFVYAPDDILSLVWIWDPVERYVYREDLSILPTDGGDISEYVGLWKYEDINLWLRIYEDETWDFCNDQEDVIYSGTLQVDETSITLYFDGTDDVLQLDCSMSDCLIDCEDGSTLVPADRIQSLMPYFTRYGLEINALVDAGTYWMEDGFGSFSGGDQFHSKGEGYTPGDCYWEVIKYYDDTYDGIREIKFDAICYVPYSSLGDIDEDYKCSIRHQLYDFYTGKWFTRIDEYKTSTRGKDYYVHTVDWNGQSGIIEFTRSHDWQRDVGEWTTVMTASYHIYMPEWYDGLVLATEPLPDNYEDFARFDSQHRAFAEASIMDIDLLDPYGCLFFNICD